MATNYLGPEAPRPFSVLSETHSSRYQLPLLAQDERFSFGEQYESRMVELIHRYLHLGTDDRLCYVGPSRGSLAPLLERRFCLLTPPVTVEPGHIHYEETPDHKMVPVRIAHIGADEFFRDEAKSAATAGGATAAAAVAGSERKQFDRVIFKDAVEFLAEPKETYRNAMRTLAAAPGGRLLIVHRPADLKTLPLFVEARGAQQGIDTPYMNIIRDLQGLGLDVQWDLECLPIVMPKLKWLAMLKDKFPGHMEGMSGLDIRLGLRELSEGMLKYGGDMLEFADRLLFVSATQRQVATYPSIQRFSASALRPFPGMENLKYHMQVTPQLEKYVSKEQREKLASGASKKKRGKLTSSYQFQSDKMNFTLFTSD